MAAHSTRRWLGRAGALGLALGLLGSTSGCTLIGAIAGAQVPHYESVSDPRTVREGAKVRVEATRVTWTERDMEVSEPARGPLQGELAENSNGTLIIVTPSRRIATIEREDTVDVEVQDGNYLPLGAAIGLAIDIAVVVAVSASLNNMFDFSSENRDWNAASAH